MNFLYYDRNTSTNPENSVGALRRNVVNLDPNPDNSRGDDIQDSIITNDTQIFVNGVTSNRSILEESNFHDSNGILIYAQATVEYYIYYTNLGGYVNVAKKIDFKN